MVDHAHSLKQNSIIPKLRQYHANYVDTDRNTKLHYAAAKGDNNGVNNYLDKDSKIVDPENYLGWTPLMMACRNGRLSTVQLLISHRANATKSNKFGMNVLHLAIASGNLELVDFILEHLFTGGISRQMLDHTFSVITTAVLFQHQNILDFLIKKYFVIDKQTRLTGVTPLMFAQAIENKLGIKILLQNNANVNLKNCLGHTFMDILTIRQHIKYVNTGDNGDGDDNNIPTVIQNFLRRGNISHPLPLVQSSSDVYPMIFMNPAQILCNPANIGYFSNNNDRKYSNNLSPSLIPAVPSPPPNSAATFIYSPEYSAHQHFTFPTVTDNKSNSVTNHPCNAIQ